MARFVAAVAAVVGWAALTLQLGLIVGNLGLPLGLWRFLGFFTILTNIGAALVATAMAMGGSGRLAGARARLMAATSIALVGIVYSLALRSLWNPTGLQKVADMALHDAAPVLFVLAWLASRHRGLAWREAGWAVLPALVYALYALARGLIDGWYAYWFLDPTRQSLGQMLGAILVLSAATGLIGAVFVMIDRALARRVAAAVPPRAT